MKALFKKVVDIFLVLTMLLPVAFKSHAESNFNFVMYGGANDKPYHYFSSPLLTNSINSHPKIHNLPTAKNSLIQLKSYSELKIGGTYRYR